MIAELQAGLSAADLKQLASDLMRREGFLRAYGPRLQAEARRAASAKL